MWTRFARIPATAFGPPCVHAYAQYAYCAASCSSRSFCSASPLVCAFRGVVTFLPTDRPWETLASLASTVLFAAVVKWTSVKALPITLEICTSLTKNRLTAINYLVLNASFYLDTGLVDYDFYSYETTGVVVYASYQFHLYPTSVIATQSCVSGGNANFIVIQGHLDFNSWVRRVTDSYYAYEAPLVACGSLRNPIYTFTITEEAYYYVVYNATSGSLLVRMRLFVNRTEYKPSQPPSCSLGSDGTCSAEAQSSTQYVLLQTGRPNNATLLTSVQSLNLAWRCDAKDCVYAAIFFVPLIVLTLIFCGYFGIFCLCGHYRDRHWSWTLAHPPSLLSLLPCRVGVTLLLCKLYSMESVTSKLLFFSCAYGCCALQVLVF